LIKIEKIKPIHWIVGASCAFVLFMFGSFLYVWNQAQDDRTGATFESNINMEDDFGFSIIRKKLTEQYQSEKQIDKSPEIDRLVMHEKQLQKKKVSQEELIEYLKHQMDTLATKYTKLESQYRYLSLKYDNLRHANAASSRLRVRSANGKVNKKTDGIDFAKYFANKPVTTELTARSSNKAISKWVKLILNENQRVYEQSVITMFVVEDFKLGTLSIPKNSQVEGICRLTRTRLHIDFKRIYTTHAEIKIEGTAFHLDKSRGIPVRVKRDDGLVESLKRHAMDAADIIDPSSIFPDVLKLETPLSREFYAELSEETMIWGRISTVEERR